MDLYLQLPLKIVQPQHTNCSLQWPEKYTVTAMQQGTYTNKTFQSAEQTVVGMENEYRMENLDLRQKYQMSIKWGRNITNSIAEIANFCK